MILDIINGDYKDIILQLQAVLLTWVLVIFAIGVDLYYGVKKSRKNGGFAHSYGFRRTSEKTVQYLSFMLFMLFFDVLNVFWVYFDFQKMPLASIFGAVVLVYTEAKSVREKTSEKFRKAIAENPAEIVEFIKDNRRLIKDLTKDVEDNHTDSN